MADAKLTRSAQNKRLHFATEHSVIHRLGSTGRVEDALIHSREVKEAQTINLMEKSGG